MTETEKASKIVAWYQQQLANAQLQVAQLTVEVESLRTELQTDEEADSARAAAAE